jgi:hypothetical protein
MMLWEEEMAWEVRANEESIIQCKCERRVGGGRG